MAVAAARLPHLPLAARAAVSCLASTEARHPRGLTLQSAPLTLPHAAAARQSLVLHIVPRGYQDAADLAQTVLEPERACVQGCG